MKPPSNYALILLLLNALPPAEDPADPASAEGAQRMAAELEESLIEHWDEMATHQTTIPLLLLSFPGFEPLVSAAVETAVARKFPPELIEVIRVPALNRAAVVRPADLLPLAKVRQDVARWLSKHAVQMVMVRPFTNHGASLDRRILQHFGAEQPPARKGLFAPQPKGDFRPLILEAVPFDGLQGPITGVFKTKTETRPALSTSAEWQAQNYRPQPADWRATGTLYFNLPMARFCLAGSQKGGLNAFEQWSLDPLLKAAQASWQAQPALFETAMQSLASILKYRQLECAPERGARGYRSMF